MGVFIPSQSSGYTINKVEIVWICNGFLVGSLSTQLPCCPPDQLLTLLPPECPEAEFVLSSGGAERVPHVVLPLRGHLILPDADIALSGKGH